MVKVHFYSLARKYRLASFYLPINPNFKKRGKRRKTKKTRENLGFFGWHPFCQQVLEVTAGHAFSRYARLTLTSKLDALCAAYVNRILLRLWLAEPSSNPKPSPTKSKRTPTGSVLLLLRRVDKKDATRLIAVSSDIVQIWL